MRLKTTGAILLFLCCAFFCIPAGALPVQTAAPMTEATEADDMGGSEEETAPEDDPPPLPAETSPPEASPLPELWPPEELEPAAPVEDGRTVIAVTLTGDEPIDNDTYYNVDPQALVSAWDPPALPAQGYQILIIHTHATEAYTQEESDPYQATDEYRTTDIEHSVVRVGEELARGLEACGLSVLHCTTLFDYPNYNGSYTRSGAAVEEYLAAYPGIRIVIDLHRDALGSGDTIYKTIADIDGLMAAQLLFVMGSDVNLDHPDWQQNLSLALTLQEAANARYGTLMRPTNLCAYRYNQQLCTGSLLLEVGTAGNTLSEALCAVRLFAETAGPILASYVED